MWICSALLITSGFFGQGVVLCLQRGEAARLEVSGNDGRCVGDRQVVSRVQSTSYRQASRATQPHDHGCEDIELAESAVRSLACDSDSVRAAPVAVIAGAFPRHDTARLRDFVPSKGHWPPASRFRDILAVHTTVILLI